MIEWIEEKIDQHFETWVVILSVVELIAVVSMVYFFFFE